MSVLNPPCIPLPLPITPIAILQSGLLKVKAPDDAALLATTAPFTYNFNSPLGL